MNERAAQSEMTNVDIQKTKLLAITFYEGKKFFIGANGKLINFYEYDKKLPFVFGKVDYKEFINLKKIIDHSSFNFENIVSFYSFQSNRWDIKIKNGTLIKLPKKKISNAITLANKIKDNDEFKNNKIIDLRIPKYIITSNE